jgi:hypothetical protein
VENQVFVIVLLSFKFCLLRLLYLEFFHGVHMFPFVCDMYYVHCAFCPCLCLTTVVASPCQLKFLFYKFP